MIFILIVSNKLTNTCLGTAHEFTKTLWQCGHILVESGLSTAWDEFPTFSRFFWRLLFCTDWVLLSVCSKPIFEEVRFRDPCWDDKPASAWDGKCFATSGISGKGPKEDRSLSKLSRLFLELLSDFIEISYWFVKLFFSAFPQLRVTFYLLYWNSFINRFLAVAYITNKG